jgi:hypothetical protein
VETFLCDATAERNEHAELLRDVCKPAFSGRRRIFPLMTDGQHPDFLARPDFVERHAA